jgi:hypothetical protein
LGLGPFGLFVAVLLCASVAGIAGYGIMKGIGGDVYDLAANMGNRRIYFSPGDLVEAIR